MAAPGTCSRPSPRIAPYTIEEAYEVADAIDAAIAAHLRDELGDLLFQVVFHARMAEERGWFDFADVAAAIRDKLERRHPHIFAGADLRAEDLVRAWEEQKAQERAPQRHLPPALPLCSRACPGRCLRWRAPRSSASAPPGWALTGREAREVRAKVPRNSPRWTQRCSHSRRARVAGAAAVAEEIGDVLFSVANWSRHLTWTRKRRCAWPTASSSAASRMESAAAVRGLDLKA